MSSISLPPPKKIRSLSSTRFPHLQNPFPLFFPHRPLLLCSPAGLDPRAPHIPAPSSEPVAADPLDPKNQENPEAPTQSSPRPALPPASSYPYPQFPSLHPLPSDYLSEWMERGVLGSPRVYLGRTGLFPTRLGPSLDWVQPGALWRLLSWLRGQH